MPHVLRWREKGTDLRHKAWGWGGKCGENRVEIHIWSTECNMKVLMSLSLEEFGAKEDWYQSEARQACETEDDLACSELNIFYQYAIEIHRMYIVPY